MPYKTIGGDSKRCFPGPSAFKRNSRVSRTKEGKESRSQTSLLTDLVWCSANPSEAGSLRLVESLAGSFGKINLVNSLESSPKQRCFVHRLTCLLCDGWLKDKPDHFE